MKLFLKSLAFLFLVSFPLPAHCQDDIDALTDKTLIQNLQNPSLQIREKAFADLLLLGPDPQRLSGLLDVCEKGTDNKNKAMAVKILTLWRSPEALLPVIQLLDSSDDNLTYGCCSGLGLLGDP